MLAGKICQKGCNPFFAPPTLIKRIVLHIFLEMLGLSRQRITSARIIVMRLEPALHTGKNTVTLGCKTLLKNQIRTTPQKTQQFSMILWLGGSAWLPLLCAKKHIFGKGYSWKTEIEVLKWKLHPAKDLALDMLMSWKSEISIIAYFSFIQRLRSYVLGSSVLDNTILLTVFGSTINSVLPIVWHKWTIGEVVTPFKIHGVGTQGGLTSFYRNCVFTMKFPKSLDSSCGDFIYIRISIYIYMICICIYMYMYIYVCVSVFNNVFKHLSLISVYLCLYICVYARIFFFTYCMLYIFCFLYTYVQKCIYIYL